jgi:pyruvate dehydrogenase E2 component (dihydrolipoamide acetyltransferase)
MNGSWVDGTFVPGDGVHVATIVALRGGGLLAPVIRDADRLDADETMRSLGDVVERARRGALRSSELSGATITVTNLGEDGVEAIFGVIHPPQVAIVGFGGLVERPVVAQGRIVAHPTLTVTLAADHRATDGRIGGRFLTRVAALLRSPERLL